MFLTTFVEEVWRSFMDEFNQRVENKIGIDAFKQELWNTGVTFGEPVLTVTGLDEKGRKGLLEKRIGLGKRKPDAGANQCKDSSSLNKKTDDEK